MNEETLKQIREDIASEWIGRYAGDDHVFVIVKNALKEYEEIRAVKAPTDEVRQFVLDLDWLTTVEFCDKYKIPHPYFTGDVKTSADQFLRLDAIKYRMIVEKAKNKPAQSTPSHEDTNP